MIGKLTGTLAERNPPQVVVDCNGVGYEVDVPMSTFYNLPHIGERISLLTHFVVREDAQILYGFGTHQERAAFRHLIKITGVGPRMALGVLSGLSVGELAQIVTLQDTGRLVKLPGIGSLAAPRKAVRAGFPPDTLVVRRTMQLRHGAKLEEGEPYPDPRAKPRHQSTYGGGR